MELIIGRRGEQPFAITDKSVSGKHLKLTTLPDGNVQVEDLGSSNGTFIDGVRIIKKVVSRNTVIQMGAHYSFRICDVLPETPKAQPTKTTNTAPTPVAPQPKTFSLAPLEYVWEQYQKDMVQIDIEASEKAKSEKKKRNISALCSSLGMLFVLVPQLGIIRYILMVVSISITAYFIFKEEDDEISVVKKNRLNEKYASKYKCPNPECGRPFGYTPYRQIGFSRQCPACNCKYKHA